MKIVNIAGYKFIALTELPSLREKLFGQLHALALKGTILLSQEGININLAGPATALREFQMQLRADERFSDIKFHEAFSEAIPFQRLKVKIKKEIITLRQPDVDVVAQPAPGLSASELKKWLDEKRDFILLDARNEFEVQRGSFENAVNLRLQNFSEFADKTAAVPRDKPIVMFCTGGIRCEKAALLMLKQGFKAVYQLDGGILGYFADVGAAHYQGECFVFDERIAITASASVLLKVPDKRAL